MPASKTAPNYENENKIWNFEVHDRNPLSYKILNHKRRYTLPRCWQARGGGPDFRQFDERIQTTFELRQVRSVSIWTMHGKRPFVYRSVCRCADLEGGEFVVRDFDGIAGVTVTSGDALTSLIVSLQKATTKKRHAIYTYLGNNFGIRL